MKLIHKIKGRIGLTIILCITAMVVISLILAYLYIHSLIRKINMVDSPGKTAVALAKEEYLTMEDNLSEEDTKLQQSDDKHSSDKQQFIDNTMSAEEDIIVTEETALPAATEVELADIEEQIKSNLAKTDIKSNKDVFNLLLIGSDARKSGGRGRADAMILLSVNKKRKVITVTSILRDIYLKIPGRDSGNRINAAYAYGGAELLLDTVEQNFKISVDKYVIVDFYAFIDLIDAVGGITAEVTQQDIPIINAYVAELNKLTGKDKSIDCLEEAGSLLLNGKQALGYARNRYVGSDFSRTQKQRELLGLVFNKVKELKISELTKLMNRLLPQLTTNLKEGEIFSLLLALPSYIKYDIKQLTIPAKGSYKDMNIRGMAVLSIDFEKNIKILHDNIYSELSKKQ